MKTRQEYIEALAAKLHELDSRIDDLKHKAETGGEKLRAGYRKSVVDLKEKREHAALLLEDLHETTDEAWDTVKVKVDRLMDDVKKIFRKAA